MNSKPQKKNISLIKFGYLIRFYDSKTGYIRKLNSQERIKFTIKEKHLLSDPPASSLPRGLRHYLEKYSAKM